MINSFLTLFQKSSNNFDDINVVLHGWYYQISRGNHVARFSSEYVVLTGSGRFCGSRKRRCLCINKEINYNEQTVLCKVQTVQDPYVTRAKDYLNWSMRMFPFKLNITSFEFESMFIFKKNVNFQFSYIYTIYCPMSRLSTSFTLFRV